MMNLLMAYTLSILLAMIWIAKDAETIYISDVFGKNFHYVWFDSGQRWTYVFSYGWRLATLCLLVLLNGFLSYRIYVINPLEIGPALRLMIFAVLLAASFVPVSWIYIAQRLRWQRLVRSTTLGLSDFVERAVVDSEFAQEFDHADYETDEPWTAWHPTQDEWKSHEFWDGLIPVVYLLNDPNRSALFPMMDWETFLAWNIPEDCVRVNDDLPVHGVFDSSFLVKSVQAIRGCPNWCIVHTEMRSEFDVLLEDRG